MADDVEASCRAQCDDTIHQQAVAVEHSREIPGRERRGELAGVGRVARHPRQGIAPGRKTGLDQRQHICPQKIARMPDIGIRLVGDPAHPALAGNRVQVGARDIEQRAHQHRPADTERPLERHGCRALDPRTAQHLQQHGLGLVIEVVRGGHDIGAAAAQAAITLVAGGGFEPEARVGRDPDPLDAQRDATTRALAFAETGPVVGVGAQPMMNVQCRQTKPQRRRQGAQHVEQHHRIHAAAQGERERAPFHAGRREAPFDGAQQRCEPAHGEGRMPVTTAG